jgi:protein-L-isoaspartate(D-aspartate) O-methyltransferase
MQSTNLDFARYNMIEQQVRPWDVLDQRVLQVMTTVHREQFVPSNQESLAFMDIEIPLGHGEAMMSPKLEGRLLQALDIKPTDVAFEIGTGSGYLTACLAALGSHVFSIDIHEDLHQQAKARLNDLAIDNTTLWTGDAAQGWKQAPRNYDVIAVTGSIPEYDPCFEQQLKLGGRLFIVVGTAPIMTATLVTRVSDNACTRTQLFETEVKSLIGREQKQQFIL